MYETSHETSHETSQPIELLLSVTRDGSRTLGAQIEDQLRRAIREGTLKAGTRVPSTRDLTRQLDVSRRVVVDAYAQLAAEGYLELRQGSRPRVSETAVRGGVAAHEPAEPPRPPRFDFRPRAPDVSSFPRTAWLRSLREALAEITNAELGYGDPRGVRALRSALAGDRRTALLAWLRARDAIAIEDDYDAEYRYDRAAVRALQGREPDRVVYAGSASKTLAPALRLGWLVVPPRLLDAVTDEKDLADCGTARIEQHAFANFLARGELDRHLRRMRARYRRRRDLLVEALAEALPEATVRGIAAGLHATVQLPDGYDEQAILRQARRRRIDLTTMRDFWGQPGSGPPTLLLGYAQISEHAIPAAVRELAEAARAGALWTEPKKVT